jgi:hypothetical protein
MTNPTQINQGGAQNQERQPPEQTGSFKPPQQPAGPYSRDKESGENPEVDDITEGDEANKRREKMQEQQKAEGEVATRDPTKKKTGEF